MARSGGVFQHSREHLAACRRTRGAGSMRPRRTSSPVATMENRGSTVPISGSSLSNVSTLSKVSRFGGVEQRHAPINQDERRT